jgi:transcriptional regulator with XRE-family HTH domain
MSYMRSIREGLGLKQGELAARFGISQSVVSRIENGKLPLDERTRLALRALELEQAEAAAAAP